METATRAQLPSPDATARMLADLVGRRVVAVRASRLAKRDVAGAAVYVDGAGEVRFIALANVAFLASAGASLALVPVAQVADAIVCGKVPSAILENSFEVLNVASVLMNELAGADHVTIASLDVGAALPDRVRGAIERATVSLDLEIEIAGYPKGRLSFLVAIPKKA